MILRFINRGTELLNYEVMLKVPNTEIYIYNVLTNEGQGEEAKRFTGMSLDTMNHSCRIRMRKCDCSAWRKERLREELIKVLNIIPGLESENGEKLSPFTERSRTREH